MKLATYIHGTVSNYIVCSNGMIIQKLIIIIVCVEHTQKALHNEEEHDRTDEGQ